MGTKKFKVTIKDKDETWTEEYADPEYPDKKAHFQNMIDRRNEKIERTYGQSASHWELVSVEEIEAKVEVKRIATWHVCLDAECPKCGECFDMLDIPDFWDGKKLEIGEHNTVNSRGVEVTCPECDHEFEVDLEY